ncbi:DUF2264 domain-containing protein [Actinomadura sp. 9N215]|uniref:DUF2264 domain-containing protein n=1 Tax=Actinomadura sp. 9N215 TaxID=3375150 RepID=UPI0037A4DC32
MVTLYSLPSEDRVRSPYTGWTRAHWEAAADRLLDAVTPYMSPQGALVRLPGTPGWSGPVVDGLEGFARCFLLAAVRLAGNGGIDRRDQAERWVRGLCAGTDRGGPEAWPPITDHSQQIVEAASIAVALHLSRPWIWDRLSSNARERVCAWLAGVVGRRVRDNNHVLFQIVVEEFLSSAGALDDRAGIEAGLARVEEWYRGDGWYQDGPRRRTDYRDAADGVVCASGYDAGERFDYYNAWGFHYYPLLWAHIAGARAGQRAVVYRARLRSFLAQYVRLFGADGAPLHHGRSLTYRFACLAPFWLGAWQDATPLAPGLTRRLASGTLRHFAAHGAPDAQGLLRPGWYGAFRPSIQPYSGPGSPYAASKGFLGLLIPPAHPVWTAAEEPLPVETGDYVTALPVPGLLVHGTRGDGVVRVLNHGSHYLMAPPSRERDDPHYAKLAYSTHTGPELGQDGRLDNHVCLISANGRASRRERVHRAAVAGDHAASWHRPLLDDGTPPDACRIDSVSVVCGHWEIRVHRVVAQPGRPLREGGYSLAGPVPPTASAAGTHAVVRRPDGLVSAVAALHGWRDADVRSGSGASAFGEHSAVPFLSGVTPPEGESIFVSAVLLGGCADPVPPAEISVTVEGLAVRLLAPGRPASLIRPGAAHPVVSG